MKIWLFKQNNLFLIPSSFIFSIYKELIQAIWYCLFIILIFNRDILKITEEYYNKLPVEPDWLSRTDLELYKYLIEKTDYAKIQCDWIKKENNSLVLQKAVMVEDENKKRSKKIFQVTLSKNMNKSDFSPQDIFVKEEFLDIE